MRSCAACMSTTTRPWAFSARMKAPASWARARPSGQASAAVAAAAVAGAAAAGPVGQRAAGSCAYSTATSCRPRRAWPPATAGAQAGRVAGAPAPVPLKSFDQSANGRTVPAGSVDRAPGVRSAWAAGAVGATTGARDGASAASTACRTAWCTSRPSRKRTSIFVGCTFTSTRSGSISMNSTQVGWRLPCSTSSYAARAPWPISRSRT